MSQLIVTDSPDEKRQPMVQVKGPGGSRKYLMPTHAHLMVHDGEEVHAGDVIAKIPRETTKTRDITGGLPRIVDLFEARKPRESAIMAEINGVVKYGESPRVSARSTSWATMARSANTRCHAASTSTCRKASALRPAIR